MSNVIVGQEPQKQFMFALSLCLRIC